MTWPVRRFCSTQARFGMAIQTGRPLTAKRMSVASAWRVAMATIVPFQTQCRSSPVQRSVILKSSYMIGSRLVQGGGLSKVGRGEKVLLATYLAFRGGEGFLGDSQNGNNIACYFRKHLKFLVAYASYPGYPFLS